MIDWNRAKQYGLVVLVVVLLLVIIWGAVDRNSTKAEMARLRNEAAMRDRTLEIQKGLYTKLTLETQDLKGLLSSKDEQVASLLDQVKRDSEELLTANQLVVTWKKAYEGAAAANQTHIDPDPTSPTKPGRDRVEFTKDFGTIGVKGYTITNPPEAWVSVKQLRPLKITVAVSQDKNKQWHSYATSNDENTTIDIALSAVNPYVLEPKWYERIQLGTSVAGGSGTAGFGFLVGIDATYKIGKFDIGPAVFVSLGAGATATPFFGAKFNWRPFEQ